MSQVDPNKSKYICVNHERNSIVKINPGEETCSTRYSKESLLGRDLYKVMKDNKWRVLAMYGGEDVAYIKLF